MPSSSRDRASPWPIPTSTPLASSPKRKRQPDRLSSVNRVESPLHHYVGRRDIIPNQDQIAQAMNRCEVDSDNSVLSCFPLSNTSVPQHQFASFVWNSRLPQFTQTNLVNIYLIRATTQEVVLEFPNVTNPAANAGVLHAPVNDTWLGPSGDKFKGVDIPLLFQWVITRADRPLDNTVQPQAIFTALQTTFADSVIASSTSAAAASSRSAASLSSAMAASESAESAALTSAPTTEAPTSAATNASGGNVQSGIGGSSFPHWAIAVIVVLGFLALVAFGILTFFILRRLRNRGRLSHRGSMGSSTPMMSNVQTDGMPQSPLLGEAAFAAAAGGGSLHRPTSPTDMQDAASTISRGSEAPFSGADAAVMADAFRAALRKPNFLDQPVEEGESPDDPNAIEGRRGELLNRELAEEGRDIRSVSSSRGVKVETLSETDADTIQDNPH